jgi:hypothetical protein
MAVGRGEDNTGTADAAKQATGGKEPAKHKRNAEMTWSHSVTSLKLHHQLTVLGLPSH